jgi:peptidoglycan/LPS O-acetylase OafA/YrhL
VKGATPAVTGLASGLAEPRLPALDGLRAVAVFLVIFYHYGIAWSPGGLGVLIFFVISGFLITWLLLKEHARHGAVSLRKFYIRRAHRIFPAIYFYAILTLTALVIFHKAVNWPQTISALFYVCNYYQAFLGDPSTDFSHTWSLAVEEQFYLLWPPLFVFLVRRGKWLAAVPALLIVFEWIYRAVLQFGLRVPQKYFYEAFDTRFDQLLVGCLLAIVLFKTRDHPGWARLSRLPWLPFATTGLLAASAALEFHFGSGYRDSLGFLFNPLLTAILIPQLIVFRGRWFAAWLQFKPVVYLGGISYSLYLYQQLVLYPASKRFHSMGPLFELAATMALLILIASASYRFIEQPFLRFKDRVFSV